MTSCNIIKEIYYLINKKVILYINYNFHNDVQHIKQIPDFIKFHELPYKKLTGDYLIRLINNDVNTIKLTIIMNHDLLAAICIVNGIRNRSVYIQDSENNLIAVGVYDNRFYKMSIMTKLKNTTRISLPYRAFGDLIIELSSLKECIDIHDYYLKQHIMVILESNVTNLNMEPNESCVLIKSTTDKKRKVADYIIFILQLLKFSNHSIFDNTNTNTNIIANKVKISPQTLFDRQNKQYKIIPINILNSRVNSNSSKIKTYSNLFNICYINDITNCATKLYNKNFKYIKNIKKLIYLLYSCGIPYELILILLSSF